MKIRSRKGDKNLQKLIPPQSGLALYSNVTLFHIAMSVRFLSQGYTILVKHYPQSVI